MDTQKFKKSAAFLCFIYILVQSFQWWVYSQFPDESDPVKSFLDGDHVLHIWRSSLMLFSMFGLWYIFAIVCLTIYKTRKICSILAFVCFSIFCFLEICLRSTELFYIQIYLPEQYQNFTDTQSRYFIENVVKVFYQVQSALYFPLGLGWMLGSILIVAASPKSRNSSFLIGAFSINAIRLFLRILTVYFGFNILADKIYFAIYLPLTVITFGLLGIWFLRSYRIDSRVSN